VRWDGHADRLARTSFAPDVYRLRPLRSAMLMVQFTTAIIGLHSFEILLWTGFYRWLCFPLWKSAFYFSTSSYAMVDYGESFFHKCGGP
jgi:hypothetical protein